ncbi:unnamed protein product [Polarella glacialis]|uniref:Uncharacterized protein n=1 Tax=Polarella glacialis TaxID=89957 RepID=A0A813IWH5_POLGL|nr:unnamed protein product [Polarella glacialis]
MSWEEAEEAARLAAKAAREDLIKRGNIKDSSGKLSKAKFRSNFPGVYWNESGKTWVYQLRDQSCRPAKMFGSGSVKAKDSSEAEIFRARAEAEEKMKELTAKHGISWGTKQAGNVEALINVQMLTVHRCAVGKFGSEVPIYCPGLTSSAVHKGQAPRDPVTPSGLWGLMQGRSAPPSQFRLLQRDSPNRAGRINTASSAHEVDYFLLCPLLLCRVKSASELVKRESSVPGVIWAPTEGAWYTLVTINGKGHRPRSRPKDETPEEIERSFQECVAALRELRKRKAHEEKSKK